MGWLGNIFGSRKRREARERVEARLRATLEERGARAAWDETVGALRSDPEADELFRFAGHTLRLGGEARLAILFDRAADAPHDTQRLFELGSALLSNDEADVAAVVLTRAIALAPFDAVIRSELALAHARNGDPESVLATLALHPCLADDPGPLFELAWASLLKGDIGTAEDAAKQLRGLGALRHKLELAIDRAKVSATMSDARDYYFVEHGGIVLDTHGPLDGRYKHITPDGDWLSRVIADAGAVLGRLLPEPRRVVALDDEHWPLAQALATACGGSVLPAGRGRLPAGVLPLWTGAMLETRVGASSRRSNEVLIFAVTVDHRRSLARAPDIVGAFTREADAVAPKVLRDLDRTQAPSARTLDFVETRRAYLPPAGERVLAAYVPDAPLAR